MNCDRRRVLILEAALRRFDHYGYRKTTMAEIAQEAGVSVGALYLCFKSKEDILLANAEQRAMFRLNEMRAVCQQPLSPIEKLEMLERVRIATAHKLCTVSGYGEDWVRVLQERFVELQRRIIAEEVALLEQILREGVERAVFDIDDISEAALCCYAAYAAFLPPHSGVLSEAQQQRAATGLTRLLLHGLLKR
jgi:AcrR family transcriptional regulator